MKSLKRKFPGAGTQFIIVYLESVMDIAKKLNPTEIALLTCMWKISVTDNEQKHNTVYALLQNKEKWAIECNSNRRSIENAIISLTSNNFIKRTGRGVYILNPEYFYKVGDTLHFSIIREKKMKL